MLKLLVKSKLSILDTVKAITPNQSKKILMVDAQSGPYFEIQDAVQAAAAGCIIQVGGGLYSKNVYIDKPNLIIEPQDKNSDIILLVQSKPSILVNMQKDSHKVTIRGIKVCHNALQKDDEIQAVETLNNLIEGFSQQHKITQNSNFHPENEIVHQYPIDVKDNCLLMVYKGTAVIENCQLSLGFIQKETQAIVPGIIANENSRLIMNETEVWGHKECQTIGIILKQANADIYNSKVVHHIMGGILIYADPSNKIKIVCNRISLNEEQGVHIVGKGKVHLNNNLIEKNGTGIKIGLQNESEISNNEILSNNMGIEIISSLPTILNNKIDQNQIGVHTLTYASEKTNKDGKASKHMVCSPTLRNNYIVFCEDMGILCSGENNQSKIEENHLIAYNTLCGIQVDKGAHPYIGNKNHIIKNFTYGILISDGGSAMIEKNEICQNIRANIAIGGKNSDLVIIKDNLISESKFDGICAIECNQALIQHNKISLNFNGIICNQSYPLLEENRIYQNKGAGVLLVNESFPTLRDNVITDNDNIGIYLKEEVNLEEEAKNQGKKQKKEDIVQQQFSNCLAEQNHVKFNELEVVQLDSESPFNFDLFKQNNEVIGELRKPKLRICTII